jgi:secreted trypsin-like serine protease
VLYCDGQERVKLTNVCPKNIMVYTSKCPQPQNKNDAFAILLLAGKDNCRGDNGGPMMGNASSGLNYELFGITSWGFDCANPVYPGKLIWTLLIN